MMGACVECGTERGAGERCFECASNMVIAAAQAKRAQAHAAEPDAPNPPRRKTATRRR